MSLAPSALVLKAPGTNCNKETAVAIEQAGGRADQVLMKEWRDGVVSLDNYQALVLPGGFSYGDDIKSGRLMGLELRTPQYADQLNRFVEAGKAVVGICNGLQVLVESGLLPDGRTAPVDGDRSKSISLVSNANNAFECRWSRLVVGDSACRFISRQLVGLVVELPSAHQEGRVAAREQRVLDELIKSKQVVFSFVDAADQPTEAYPDNPNGSYAGMTGFCDSSGVVLGMMPHPERAITRTQYPNWRRGEGADPFGAILFKGIVDYAKEL